MMQWKGPCWCKGVLGSICMRSMPWFLAYSMRDFWRKLSTFLGSRAKPTRYLGAANSDMSLCCVCVFFWLGVSGCACGRWFAFGKRNRLNYMACIKVHVKLICHTNTEEESELRKESLYHFDFLNKNQGL